MSGSEGITAGGVTPYSWSVAVRARASIERHLFRAMCVAAVACGSDPDPGVDRYADMRVDLEIGVVEGDRDYVFGEIAGIALDDGGRVFVADRSYHTVRVFDGEGRALFTIGGRGHGPGELSLPCCVEFDPQGRLWVWSGRDELRYDVFEVTRSGSVFAFRVPGQALSHPRTRRILFDAEGNVIHPKLIQEGERGIDRITLNTTQVASATVGTDRGDAPELRRVHIPYVPPDSFGMYPVNVSFGEETRVLWNSGPATASHPTVHSPTGGFADAITSTYRIRWYDDAGQLVRVVDRPIESGPAYTAEERANMEEDVREERESISSLADPPHMEVPTHRHPIETIFFDLAGRLWVQRSIASADTIALADVFDPDGTYRMTARWPSRVLLHHGTITGNTAWGVSHDELDVPRLARLRIGPVAR